MQIKVELYIQLNINKLITANNSKQDSLKLLKIVDAYRPGYINMTL